MADPFNLQRFIDAQDAAFADVLAELTAGAKRSHWMWFIFPQLRGLGLSATARYYAIASIEEARALLDHPVLGPRLTRALAAALRSARTRTAEQMFGQIDALKLRSSLTLFDRVEPNGLFAEGLSAFYNNQRDERTLALLTSER